MRSFTLLGWGRLAAFVALLFAPVAWADESAQISPDEAVALALAAHPRVLRADATLLNAKAARSGSAVFLNNPSVSGWATTDLERMSFTASQPLSLSGEGWHARSAARHGLRSAEANLERTRREVAAETRVAWLNASVATGRVQVAVEGAALAARLLYAISRKNEEGEASTLDLRLSRMSQVQAAVRLMSARRQQANALRALSAWTLRPVTSEEIGVDPLAAAPAASDGSTTERSDVTAARRSLASAQSQLSRQRARAVPPVSIGLGLDLEDGETFFGPSVGMTLPVFNRNQRGRADAKGTVAIAEGRLDVLVASAQTERQTAEQRVIEADRLTDTLGGDLLEEARLALASVEAGVLAGEIDLSTAVLLQAQVLNGQTAIVSMRGLVASARIDLLLATDDNALLGGAP